MGGLLGLAAAVGVILMWQGVVSLRRRARGVPEPLRARPGQLRAWSLRRRELIRQAGFERMRPGQLLGIQVAASLGVGIVVLIATHTTAVAVCFGLFAALVPVTLVRRARLRRMTEFRAVWPEAIDNLASAIRAGMALPDALAALALRGPASLRPAFASFGSAYVATGRFGHCLDTLKAQLAEPVADRVCETLRLAGEVGGSEVSTMLRTLSELLRIDARTRAELETRQGWTVNAARLAVAAPWLVLLLLGTQPTTLTAFDSSSGIILLASGATASAVAYRLMLRLGRLPEQPRVLR
ncbi:MAG: Type secretion system [Frankiales bacterium]|nr:Type secretion system [Frankiales bacterium]